MKLVIDISEDDYNFILEEEYSNYAITTRLYNAVYKSTPLPKGHGRLIDADKLYSDLIFPSQQFAKAYKETLDDAQTIVEADDTESEDKE